MLFWDTESTDLGANWGRILCSSFITVDPFAAVPVSDPYTFRLDAKPWKPSFSESLLAKKRKVPENEPEWAAIDDYKLCLAIKQAIEECNVLVTWNGKRHDIPLVNARLSKHRLPLLRPQMHLDLMDTVAGNKFVKQSQLKVGRKGLDYVAKYYGVASEKTPLNGDTWQAAARGAKSAMNAVVEHCEVDCIVLKDVYPYLLPRVKSITRGE